jgi:signal transduction histidine kinase
MNRLIGDLVDVASIDAGKLAIEPQAFDAAELISEAIEAFAHAAREKAITLQYDSSERSVPATFDYERMLQVLANLITNAIKFTDRGGAVTVRAKLAADELHVSVADTGTGIPEEMLDAIFERFWQVGKNDHRGWASACTSRGASWKHTAGASGPRADSAPAARFISRSSRAPGAAPDA